ncbi:hypothetical protein [Ottowia sp.]|uniref:hypothetical protein n=1 Tax=Ottowia sp. TaxID=1898956 RepID=UPI0025D92866|nr:hypothetical protein [Ottowia sp.]MBK6616098.1 hypothetical protein [Ottowia sp.]
MTNTGPDSALIQRLSAGATRLSDYGPQLTVEFDAHQFQDARVVWRNTDWLASCGVDAKDSNTLGKLDEWLVDDFAYATPSDGLLPGTLGTRSQRFQADRYGNPVGSDSGGSGRVGIRGEFHVKGCGSTPLVGKNTSWMHSHGCLWMEEAIREAIYSRIASKFFPHSSLPVVAIIDTGVHFIHFGHGGEQIVGARRAMVVRPNFLRPASFQRSIMFGTAGTADSDQYLDALRVRGVVQRFASDAASRGSTTFEDVADLFIKLAEQVGSGWAHRLSHDFLASNLTIRGELVDFGGFRAVPTWRRADYFGREFFQLGLSLDSLSFFLRKYSGTGFSVPEKDSLKARMRSASERSFRAIASSVMGDTLREGVSLPSEFVDAAWASFNEQQDGAWEAGQGHVDGRRVLWPGAAGPGLFPIDQPGSASLAEMVDQARISCARLNINSCAAQRWLRPKRLWYRESVLRLCRQLSDFDSVTAPRYQDRLDSFIRVMAARY